MRNDADSTSTVHTTCAQIDHFNRLPTAVAVRRHHRRLTTTDDSRAPTCRRHPVRLLPMMAQVRHLIEARIAQLATIRPFVCVHVDVTVQIAFLVERLRAQRTLEPLLGLMGLVMGY